MKEDKEEEIWFKGTKDALIQITLIPWYVKFVLFIEIMFFPRYMRKRLNKVYKEYLQQTRIRGKK